MLVTADDSDQAFMEGVDAGGDSMFDYSRFETTATAKLSYDENSTWELQLKLCAERLRYINPVPLIMSQINTIEGTGPQWQSVHTILAELFMNALDHGVLGLNSELKSSAEGFGQYFNERKRRLNNVDTGFVNISLKYFNRTGGGKMIINVKDSGPGFDVLGVIKTLSKTDNVELAYAGRGLLLVKQLCDSVEFKDKGTLAEAIYLW